MNLGKLGKLGSLTMTSQNSLISLFYNANHNPKIALSYSKSEVVRLFLCEVR